LLENPYFTTSGKENYSLWFIVCDASCEELFAEMQISRVYINKNKKKSILSSKVFRYCVYSCYSYYLVPKRLDLSQTNNITYW